MNVAKWERMAEALYVECAHLHPVEVGAVWGAACEREPASVE